MTTDIDPAKAEAFGGRLVEMLNAGSTMLGISLGHRVGLFDSMAEHGGGTSEEVAAAAGVNERYAREWLNLMAVSQVVEYDAGTQRYRLPPEHAASLKRAAGPANLAPFGRMLQMAGEVETELVEAFRHGGGVPYEHFGTAEEIIFELGGPIYDAQLVDLQIPLASGLPERLDAGIDVIDLGCGRGHATNVMAQAWPNSRFTGYDFLQTSIATARAEAAELRLENVTFEVQDIAALTDDGRADLVTAFDIVHDQAKPATVLANAYRLLRADGVFFCADIAADSDVANNLDHPFGPAFYSISLFHCMTVSLAYEGEGLGTMWGEQKATEMMRAAGFEDVEVKHLEGTPNAFYIATKR